MTLARPPLIWMAALPFAAVVAHFTPDQCDLIRWYWFEGVDQHEIGGWLNITRQAVGLRLDTIRARLKALGITPPQRHAQTVDTRHVRNAGNMLRIA